MNHDGTRDPAHGDGSAAAAASNLTVAGDIQINASTAHARGSRSSSSSSSKQKLCCHCGKDVAHEERFKDRAGNYWCMDCGVEENRTKHTIGAATAQTTPCADCSQPFPAEQLVERDHLKLCPGCAEKREQQAQKDAARQAARKAAAIQEAIDAERRQRHILIGVGIGAAALVAIAVYVIAF